jgi:16S rRNA (cytosine967-C5)-methyltransferase
MSNSRKVALQALLAVEASDAYLNLVLPKLIGSSKLSTPDAAFATELAYGTSRNQGFYDYVIEKAGGRKPSEIDTDVLCSIRMGTHQLLVLETPAHAAIFETVELVKRGLRGSASGFTNAVMRKIAQFDLAGWLTILEEENLVSEDFQSIRFSHPIWVTRAIRLALESDGASEQLEEALNADNANPKVHLVKLPGKSADTSRLVPGPASPIGFTLESGDPSKFQGVADGAMRVQDQGSQLVTLALAQVKAIEPGEHWLDVCAGPGGKAVLLAALALPSGAALTTNEVTPHRATLVATALRHSGFEATQLVKDARALPESLQFDRIMLDAPCTGLGALRRRPESRWRKGEGNLKELTTLQRELLTAAWDHLKPGGILAYVTCSPHPAETTAQIEWFLRSRKDCALLDATEVFVKLNPELSLNPKRKTVQLWPHRNGTDAMFLALLQKSNG